MNKATVEIDCGQETISIFGDDMDRLAMARQIEVSRAYLIAMLMVLRGKDLMKMSKQELLDAQLLAVRTPAGARAENPFEGAALEWLKGCSCAEPQHPEECKECTDAFLRHIKALGWPGKPPSPTFAG